MWTVGSGVVVGSEVVVVGSGVVVVGSGVVVVGSGVMVGSGFEHYQIKFWTERNLVKGGANPGDRTRTRETSDHGRYRNRVQNGPECNVPMLQEGTG